MSLSGKAMRKSKDMITIKIRIIVTIGGREGVVIWGRYNRGFGVKRSLGMFCFLDEASSCTSVCSVINY